MHYPLIMNTIPFTLRLLLMSILTGFASAIHAQTSDEEFIEIFTEYANVIDEPRDLTRLAETIEDERRLVLMGEASHGTHEYYRYRAELSRHLIANKGFRFVAVEADWPAALEVNKYVKHKEDGPETAEEALESFERWPEWMWRNEEVKELIEWMHEFNADQPSGNRAGFYGIDLYEKQRAMGNVISRAENYDRNIAQEIERAYECLSGFRDAQAYIRHIHHTQEDCSGEMARATELIDQHRQHWQEADSAGFADAYQSARMAKRAEQHYRANLTRGPDAWNYRATHFFETAERLLDAYGPESRGIVWAHNTHIGDARATEMQRHQRVNIGQLARENLGPEQVFALGFGTYTGTVYAGREWEGAREEMQVPEAQPHSIEDLMERTGKDQFMLPMHLHPESFDRLTDPRGHRAIGVTYNPEQEARANYVNTILPRRYDAFIFIRETSILHALDD